LFLFFNQGYNQVERFCCASSGFGGAILNPSSVIVDRSNEY